jgi:hypothetical protein
LTYFAPIPEPNAPLNISWNISRTQALLAAGSGLLLFLLRTQAFTGDGIEYSLGIASGENMWHPHHLLFIPINHWLYQLIAIFGLDPDPFWVAQFHNAVFGGLSVGAFYRIQRNIWEKDHLKWLFVAAFLFSYGFWTFSTQIEVYVPGLCFLLLLLAGGSQPMRVFYLGMAVLYHQVNVLFVVPLLAAALISGGRKAMFVELRTAAVAGVLVFLLYLVGMAQAGLALNMGEFFSFTLSYELAGNPGWGTVTNMDWEGLRALFLSQAQGLLVPWTPKLAWLVWPLAAGTVAMLGLWIVRPGLRRSIGASDPARPLRAAWTIWFWLLSYLLFFWWWLPSEREFAVLVVPAIILLASILLSGTQAGGSFSPWVGRLLLIPVLGMFLLNGRTFLKAGFEADPTRAEAEWIAAHFPECRVFADHHLGIQLKHLAGKEFVGMEGWMKGYYHPDPESAAVPMPAGCSLIGVEFLDPGWQTTQENGYTHRDQWRAFVYDLFGVHRSELGQQEKRFKYQIVEYNGKAFVEVLPERVAFEGEEAFWESLDQEIRSKVPEAKPEFLRWYRDGND